MSAVLWKWLAEYDSYCKLISKIWQKREPGFNLTTRDSHFTILVEVFTNYNVAENMYFTNHREWAEHRISALKPASRYQIIPECHDFIFKILINNFHHHSCFCRATVFYGLVYNKLKRRDNYLLIHLLWRQKVTLLNYATLVL